jgi:hypothetical protein
VRIEVPGTTLVTVVAGARERRGRRRRRRRRRRLVMILFCPGMVRRPFVQDQLSAVNSRQRWETSVSGCCRHLQTTSINDH